MTASVEENTIRVHVYTDILPARLEQRHIASASQVPVSRPASVDIGTVLGLALSTWKQNNPEKFPPSESYTQRNQFALKFASLLVSCVSATAERSLTNALIFALCTQDNRLILGPISMSNSQKKFSLFRCKIFSSAKSVNTALFFSRCFCLQICDRDCLTAIVRN